MLDFHSTICDNTNNEKRKKKEKKVPVKNDEIYIRLNTTVPSSVMRKVRILLTNPMTGRILYGSMSALITTLLKNWLDEQILAEKKKEENGSTSSD